jgi:hypothetical protein
MSPTFSRLLAEERIAGSNTGRGMADSDLITFCTVQFCHGNEMVRPDRLWEIDADRMPAGLDRAQRPQALSP